MNVIPLTPSVSPDKLLNLYQHPHVFAVCSSDRQQAIYYKRNASIT